MASDLTGTEVTDLAKVSVAPDNQPTLPQAPARPNRMRFFVIYGILGLALAASIVGLVVFANRSVNPAPAWSSWKPNGGGLGAAKQIADHVSSSYHLPSGNQLVDVIAKAPSVSPANQQIPIHFVAIRGTNGRADAIFPVDSSDSLMFSLCGLGQACSIATGKPSVERGTLVRREILELALYTFKYVHGVNHVIAFMPPTPGNQPQYAVYIQRNDLAPELKEPLTRTLGTKVPQAAKISPREQQTIDKVTQSRVYKYSLSQAQQGDAILVLSPLAA
jgi:hypothetical protein